MKKTNKKQKSNIARNITLAFLVAAGAVLFVKGCGDKPVGTSKRLSNAIERLNR